MSVTYEETSCKTCKTDYTNGYNQDYCSEYCKISQQGQRVLNAIKHDHRLCSTCFRQLKEVETPTYETTKNIQGYYSKLSVIGFQYLEPHVTSGDYGTECSCGNIQHSTEEEALRSIEPYAYHLKHAILLLNQWDKLEQDLDLRAFAEEYKQTNDLSYSIGKTLT